MINNNKKRKHRSGDARWKKNQVKNSIVEDEHVNFWDLENNHLSYKNDHLIYTIFIMAMIDYHLLPFF